MHVVWQLPISKLQTKRQSRFGYETLSPAPSTPLHTHPTRNVPNRKRKKKSFMISHLLAPRASMGWFTNIPTKPASTNIADPLTFYTKLRIQTKPTKTLPPSTKAQSPRPIKPRDTNQKLNSNRNHQPGPKTTSRRRQKNKPHKKKQNLTT